MIKFYQLESCPDCARVRRFFGERGIPFEALPVSRHSADRRGLLSLPGVDSSELPVIVDAGTVVQGLRPVLEHLQSRFPSSRFGDPAHAVTRVLDGLEPEEAAQVIRTRLVGEGFDVVAEISLSPEGEEPPQARLLVALDAEQMSRVLREEPGLATLVVRPVVIVADGEGRSVASALDPSYQVIAADRPELGRAALRLKERLEGALAPADLTS